MLTRIAPTPSGYLHIGNAFSFLLSEYFAKERNGKILLRIDDMDAERKRSGYVQDIFDSLHWLEIEWQDGPKDADDFEKHWSQQNRMPLYEKAIRQLIDEKKVFACSCSRKQLQEKGNCDCREKNIPLHTADTALRIFVPENTVVRFGSDQINLFQETGHFIVRRRDGIPAYQLSSLADDLHFGIDFIVRGNDLLHSTAAQIFLAKELNDTAFEKIQFVHHPLLKDDSNEKLSKSAGALSLKTMRENGIKPAEIREQFRRWLNENKPAIAI